MASCCLGDVCLDCGVLTSNCLVSQQVHQNETNLRAGMLTERVREKGDRQFSSLAT